MELPIFALFLACFILIVGSHPKNSETIPKEYYRRQILQPIPGYIPVYIKADPEPIVRSQTKTNITPQKGTEVKEKQLFKQNKETLDSKSSKEKLEEVKSEASVMEPKVPLVKLKEKFDSLVDQTKINKKENSEVQPDILKP